jgi:hypothetical protein
MYCINTPTSFSWGVEKRKAVGVRKVGKRFQAYHGQSKKFKSIGYFDTFDQAVEARATYLRENNIVPKIGRPKKVNL